MAFLASALYNQLLGTINIASIWVFLFFGISYALFSFIGIVFASFVTGLYIAYAAYSTTKKTADGFLFFPTGEFANRFESLIKQCDMSVDTVRIRYAYTDDAIAMVIFNTLVVDPMLWQVVDADPEAIKAQDVIRQHVLASVTADKKILQEHIRSLLSVPVQNFIFKHELGHIVYHYSIKRIFLMGCIAGTATATALIAAKYVMSVSGFLAIICGILAGFVIDLILSYASNIFVKRQQEKNADLFAAQHSSYEEIEAAATFFEQYELCAQAYKKSQGHIAYLPQVILSGHPSGRARARYLRLFNR